LHGNGHERTMKEAPSHSARSRLFSLVSILVNSAQSCRGAALHAPIVHMHLPTATQLQPQAHLRPRDAMSAPVPASTPGAVPAPPVVESAAAVATALPPAQVAPPLPGIVPVRVLMVSGGSGVAGATLDGLRKEARRLGEVEYERGPGLKRARRSGGAAVDLAQEKKEKKSQSAYVSRFAAKDYERLLEEAVCATDAALARGRAANAGMKQDNMDMREQIEALEAAVGGGAAAMRMRLRKTEECVAEMEGGAGAAAAVNAS
jgi:hypothetical protein